MSSLILTNIFRLVILALIQVLVLQQIQVGANAINYISLFIYPVGLLLLPLRTPRIPLLLIGFVLGFIVDVFYDSPGVHAGASVFTAFLRPFWLTLIEPREGYNVNFSPTATRYGMSWFFRYVSVLYFVHLFIFFSYEVFTHYRFGEIILRTFLSFVMSMLLVFIYVFIFRPKD